MSIEYEDYLHQMRTFMANTRLTVSRTEVEATSRDLGYTGTCDILAWDADGNLVVVEIKTGRWHSQMHAVQVAGYMHALGAVAGYVVYITPDRYTAYEVNPEYSLEAFKAILVAESIIEDGDALWRPMNELDCC